MPFFKPPTVATPVGKGPLLSRMMLPRGVSVCRREDGTFQELQFPLDRPLLAGECLYLGGRVHVVDDVRAAELVAAGYGDGVYG